MNRKPIFDAVRKLRGRGFTQAEVDLLDRAIDRAMGALRGDEPAMEGPRLPDPPAPVPGRGLGRPGERLIKSWEGCHRRRADGQFEAYPDPGSADGRPWTIGWGSTGPDVRRGTVWTQAECDARFDRDIRRHVDEVARAIGDAPTSGNQFDALVSFHYNTGAIFRATLTRKHRAGDFAGAAAEFRRWIHNDGRALRGLRNRRAAEARLYAAT